MSREELVRLRAQAAIVRSAVIELERQVCAARDAGVSWRAITGALGSPAIAARLPGGVSPTAVRSHYVDRRQVTL